MSEEFVVAKNATVHQAGADRDITNDLRISCERSLYVLCKAVLGMTAFTTHLHVPLCRWMQTVPARKKLLLTPRGTFKTSMARGLAMFATIQKAYSNPLFPGKDGRDLRILFAAENEKRALTRIGWIRRQYMHNMLFRALWPEVVWESEQDADTWTTSRFSLPRTIDNTEATFESAGVDSGSTGGHFDMIIKDDLIGLRSRKQPELMKAANEWWDSSHSYFDNENESLDYVFGTRWSAEDLYSHIFEYEMDYDIRIYSATERPDDLPLTGDPDKRLLFPERLSRIRLEEMRRKYGELYYLNYENAPYRGGNTAFSMELCGSFVREGEIISFNDDEITKKTLEIIEHGNVVPKVVAKPKPFFRMSGEERTAAWMEMQNRWRSERVRKVELS